MNGVTVMLNYGKVESNSSGRSAHSAVQTVKKTKTGLELGNLHAKLA